MFEKKLVIASRSPGAGYLACEAEKLVRASISTNSWKNSTSGVNAFLDFEFFVEEKFKWPVNIEAVRSFATYCIMVRKVQPSTTKAYIASLRMGHELKGLVFPNCSDDRILKMILNGAKNVMKVKDSGITQTRRVMSLPTLKILGHKIAASVFSSYDKQVIWTACTTGFFSSVRMGEILSDSPKKFAAQSTFLWKHVKFLKKDDILLCIPFTKTNRYKGEFVDLFSFENMPCCPIAAFRKLEEMAVEQGLFGRDRPVFTMSDGSFLTTTKLNALLKNFLQDIFIHGINTITCHSFRSAIPSAIAKFPEKTFVADVKEWGNWKSESFQKYTRLKKDKRKFLYSKIVHVLLNDCE